MDFLHPFRLGFMMLTASSVALIAVPSFTKPMIDRFMRNPARPNNEALNQLERRCEESRINLFHLPLLTGRDANDITVECRQHQAALRSQQPNTAQGLRAQPSNQSSNSQSSNSQSPRSRIRPTSDRPVSYQSPSTGSMSDRPAGYQSRTPRSMSDRPAYQSQSVIAQPSTRERPISERRMRRRPMRSRRRFRQPIPQQSR
jgi:hypothetical protein